MRAIRCERGKVDTVVDDKGFDLLWTISFPPPAAHKLGLIDNLADKAGTQQYQQPVAVFRSQEVPRAGVKTAVQPVDTIQTLDYANPISTGAPKPRQIPNTAS